MPVKYNVPITAVAARRPPGRTPADAGELYFNDTDEVLGITKIDGSNFDFLSSAGMIFSDAPPAAPKSGDLWYRTLAPRVGAYAFNGTSWVSLAITGATLPAPVTPLKFTFADTPPVAPTAGDQWYKTIAPHAGLYAYNGSTWVNVA